MDPRQLMVFVDLGGDYWLRLDQIASIQPLDSQHLHSRIYQIGTGYIDATLTVPEVMERIKEATSGP